MISVEGLGSAEGSIYVFKDIFNILIHTKTKANFSYKEKSKYWIYCMTQVLEITGSNFFVKKLRIFWTLIIITMYLMMERACLEVCDNVLCVISFIF